MHRFSYSVGHDNGDLPAAAHQQQQKGNSMRIQQRGGLRGSVDHRCSLRKCSNYEGWLSRQEERDASNVVETEYKLCKGPHANQTCRDSGNNAYKAEIV